MFLSPNLEYNKTELGKILHKFNDNPDQLIPVLQEIQEEFGYLPKEAMAGAAKYLRVPESKVYAVASFYSQFRFEPKGRRTIQVCRGTACHVKGAPRILEEFKRVLGVEDGGTTEDGEYTLETVACLGCCALAPAAMVDEEVYANLTPQKVQELFGSR